MNRYRYILQKAVYYFVLLFLSLMVEDDGEFRMALIGAIVLSEVTIHFLQKKSSRESWFHRPWSCPAVAFLLSIFLLLARGVVSLSLETLRG